MGGLLVLVIGAVLGLGTVGIAIGLPISALIVLVMWLSMLGRRDFVPVVYNLRSLAVRKVTTALAGAGLALVVCVFATVLMLAQGIKKTLASTGQPDNVKILRKGSQNEIQSGVQPEQVRLLSSAPEVAVGPDGQALVSPETLVLIFAMKEGALSDTEGTNLQVRGVSPRGTELHRVKIEGRLFQPGTSEVVIGKALAGRFQGMRPGGQVHFARRDWNVVGVIDSAGSGFDSEVWGDEDQFLDAFQRRGGFSAVTMRLKDPGLFSALEARMASDPGLSQLEVRRESEYYESQSEQFAAFVKFLGVFVAVIFAFGAALGAMITMYSQVAARTREIGTLRALGFRRRAVMVSFLIESVILGLLAGVVGLALASLVQLKTFSTMNFQSFSEVTFRFTLTGPIAAWSMLFAAVMGYAGGLLPATRAARMPIVEATRGG
jgi:putative ABC transport system permease protein